MPNSPDGRRPSKADAKHTAAHDAIMHAFQMFDIDSDGRITREEFVSALTRKCAKDGGAHSLTEDQANALFDEADVDRSNCIDAEEFAEKWFEFEGSYGMTRIARAKRAISKAASFTAEKLHLTSSHKGDGRKSQAKKKGVKAEV